MTLCFIDTETTGLDVRIHQPYEVCWWLEDEDQPITMRLPHSLVHADQQALKIGGYFDRQISVEGEWTDTPDGMVTALARVLNGVTLVGSNPAFDAAMLTRFIGTPIWHHRMIDVAQAAMWVLDTGRPIGLAEVRTRLVDLGYEIPEPDHTAEGDVRTTRAAYAALRDVRGCLK